MALGRCLYRSLTRVTREYDHQPLFKAVYQKPMAIHKPKVHVIFKGKSVRLVQEPVQQVRTVADVAMDLIHREMLGGDNARLYRPHVSFQDITRRWFRDPLGIQERHPELQSVSPQEFQVKLHDVAFAFLRQLSSQAAEARKCGLLDHSINAFTPDVMKGWAKPIPTLKPYPGICLVAHPFLDNDYWGKKVVMLTSQTGDGGWRGLILNKPSVEVDVLRDPHIGDRRLVDAVDEHEDERLVRSAHKASDSFSVGSNQALGNAFKKIGVPLLEGGPVRSRYQLLCHPSLAKKLDLFKRLHSAQLNDQNVVLLDDLELMKDYVQRNAQSKELKQNVRLFNKECVWGPGDLEDQMLFGEWFVVSVSANQCFNSLVHNVATAPSVWECWMQLLGGEYCDMSAFPHTFVQEYRTLMNERAQRERGVEVGSVATK